MTDKRVREFYSESTGWVVSLEDHKSALSEVQRENEALKHELDCVESTRDYFEEKFKEYEAKNEYLQRELDRLKYADEQFNDLNLKVQQLCQIRDDFTKALDASHQIQFDLEAKLKLADEALCDAITGLESPYKNGPTPDDVMIASMKLNQALDKLREGGK